MGLDLESGVCAGSQRGYIHPSATPRGGWPLALTLRGGYSPPPSVSSVLAAAAMAYRHSGKSPGTPLPAQANVELSSVLVSLRSGAKCPQRQLAISGSSEKQANAEGFC